MSSTVASNELMQESATFNDDAPRNCDTTPTIPINLISHLILPFLQDRRTWNAICSANKELHQAGLRMTPPWPATKLKLGRRVGVLKFSPCGSFLASGTFSPPYLVHFCDRRGRKMYLTGHTSGVQLLAFSNDGNYLASLGCSHDNGTSIRIWKTDSTTRWPQSERNLPGHQGVITCLDFSPSDSTLLVSGHQGAIKLWNVEQEVCIYSFDHSCGSIQSLYFPVQDEGHKCIFVTARGSLIRTWWNDPSGSIESDIVNMPGLGQVWTSAFFHCGSLLAAVSLDGSTVTLYDMRVMTVVRRLSIHGNTLVLGPSNGLDFSPSGKTLVFGFNNNEIQIREVPDLNLLRRLLQPDASAPTSNGVVAFEPSGQFVASAGGDENIRLWTL
jgi:WD40 repeat protein